MRGAYSAEFASYGILGRDVTYCGTDLPTFRTNLGVSFSLVGIYRPLEHVVFLALGTVNMWVVQSKCQEKISAKNLINAH